ncbi:hypothetical protein GCM10010466_51710 [Planomonospora alba]|uniref:Uncharacterized protein n=1 Tax=Planomonospora alba TaxID=161354 RepID=A0ABP6NU17_9ACTN
MLRTPVKRTAAIAALMAAFAGALGGCGGGGDEDAETPDVVETGSPGVENDGEVDNDGDGD